jgi:hypothetical protein
MMGAQFRQVLACLLGDAVGTNCSGCPVLSLSVFRGADRQPLSLLASLAWSLGGFVLVSLDALI